jgi:hypothetical protein
VAFVDEAIAVRDSPTRPDPALIFTAADGTHSSAGQDGEFDL